MAKDEVTPTASPTSAATLALSSLYRGVFAAVVAAGCWQLGACIAIARQGIPKSFRKHGRPSGRRLTHGRACGRNTYEVLEWV
jgi:hypothetical protein